MKASEILQKLQEIERELDNLPVTKNSNFSEEYPYNISIPEMISSAKCRIRLAIEDLRILDEDKNLEFTEW